MKRRLSRNCTDAKQQARVLNELDLVVQGDVQSNNPIEEQLRQCPEAFAVGKIVEKLCDSLKHGHERSVRVQPLPGVIIPPIV